MKHRLFKSILSVAAVIALAFAGTLPASAQKGEKTLGVAGGFASYNDGGYGKLYFQYTVVNHVRIAPEMGYVFRNKGASAFEFSADVQFPFRVAKGFALYPLVGFTLNSWNYQHDDSATRAGVDFGGGMEFYLTPNLKLSLQGKYSAMNDTGGGFIDMGIGYVF